MIKPFSPVFLRICLLISGGLFIAVGIVVLSSGIYTNQKSSLLSTLKHLTKGTTNGAICIVAGCFDIAMGANILTCALMEKRGLLVIHAALMVGSIVGNLCFLILFGVTVAGSSKLTKSAETFVTESVAKRYGDTSVPESRDFTSKIDEYQKRSTCCGWKDTDTDNIYLKTPWHAQVNLNITASQRRILLPDSCCIKAGDDCRWAQSIPEARSAALIHNSNCLKLLTRDLYASTLLIVILMLFRILMQGACAALLVQTLSQNEEESTADEPGMSITEH